MSANFSLEGDYTLDTSVLVEMLSGTAIGAGVSSLIERRAISAHTSHVNIAETGYVLCRKIGHEKASTSVRELLDSSVLVLEESREIHTAVSRIKCERAVSLGDSYTLAVSEVTGTRPVFLGREEEITAEMSKRPFKLEPVFLR